MAVTEQQNAFRIMGALAMLGLIYLAPLVTTLTTLIHSAIALATVESDSFLYVDCVRESTLVLNLDIYQWSVLDGSVMTFVICMLLAGFIGLLPRAADELGASSMQFPRTQPMYNLLTLNSRDAAPFVNLYFLLQLLNTSVSFSVSLVHYYANMRCTYVDEETNAERIAPIIPMTLARLVSFGVSWVAISVSLVIYLFRISSEMRTKGKTYSAASQARKHLY